MARKTKPPGPASRRRSPERQAAIRTTQPLLDLLASSEITALFDRAEREAAQRAGVSESTAKWPRNLETVIRVLALTRGLEYAPAVGRIAALQVPADLPHLASMLAAGQRPDVIVDLLEGLARDASHLEFFALLTQELAIRTEGHGDGLTEPVSGLEPFVQRLREVAHPLGPLPAHRLDVEAHVRLRQYFTPPVPFKSPYSIEASWGPPSNTGAGSFVRDHSNVNSSLPATHELPISRDAELMVKPVVSWREHGSGKYEARVFRLERAVTPSEICPALLERLPLACLLGMGAGTLTVQLVPPTYAFARLFAPAQNGGATGGALYAAYGRLAAWRSVEGFLGTTGHPARPESLAEEMHRAAWYVFDAHSPWFTGGWKLGLAALRPDGRTLAILSACDHY